MGGSNFELIAQEILQKKLLMEKLEEENEELRRQLADLRTGRGIFVEIGGTRFALWDVIETAPPIGEATTHVKEEGASIPETPTAMMVPVAASLVEESTPALEEEEMAAAGPGFLEEMMLNEFTSALTSPMAVWTGPVKKPEGIDEEQKERLRRELMGSYMLE